MSVEKMKILKMLEEGKISAEDAAKLLSAADVPESMHRSTAPKKPEPQINEQSATFQPNSPRPSTGQSSSSGSSLAEDLGKKFDAFMRDFEPKLRSFSEAVVGKTAAAADSLSKSLSSQSRATVRTNSAPTPYSSGDIAIEIKVSSPNSTLDLSALNGSVLLMGYNGDKITAKIRSKSRKRNEKVGIMTLGNKYILTYDEDDFDMVSIDAYIPYNMFSSIRLSATNGAVSLSGVNSGEIIISNSNADISVTNVTAETVKIDSQNSRDMKLSNIRSEYAEVEASNGAIHFSENDIENLKLIAYNSPVSVSLSSFNSYSEYLWVLETSNQKLNVFLPSVPTVGYYVKAAASLGSIKIGLTGMNYIFSDNYNSEAKSIHYDSSAKKVRISLETSNAPLNIN